MATYSSGPYNSSAIDLQPEMTSGETLLWTGQPLQSVVFHATDWAAIPFSLMWGGFAIFWEWGVTGHFGNAPAAHHAPDFFMLWGIPFVLIGQYMIWGRFLWTAWKKGRTHYGVTNKRVLVLYVGSSRKVTDAYLQSLDSVTLTTRSNGIGSIEFAPDPRMESAWGWNNRRRNSTPMGIDLSRLAFFDIDGVREVYQLIQSQRERLRDGRSGSWTA
jgi:hypothetical protein